MNKQSRARNYAMEPRNRLFEGIRGMIETEIHPGRTVTFVSQVDLTQVEAARQGAAQAGISKPSYTAFVVKATALALREFPYANRRVARRIWTPWAYPRVQKFFHCDIAVAVERAEEGAESVTFADILRDADQLPLAEITRQLADLARSTKENNRQWRDFHNVMTRTPSWLGKLLLRLPLMAPSLWVKWRGAAVLVSSPAKNGVDSLVATWTSPLGVSFGLVKPRPVVVDGEVVARPTFNLVLTFDRRIMAGAQAARFFSRIVDILQKVQECPLDGFSRVAGSGIPVPTAAA